MHFQTEAVWLPKCYAQPRGFLMFHPNAHLAREINSKIVEAEIEGGVDLTQVAPDTIFEVATESRTYTVEYKGSGKALISGHPVFCPEPLPVRIHGSTWGGSLIMKLFMGRGMRLEFALADGEIITTSRIRSIREGISRERAA
jgi:hypothetical protein